jgi:hypothetical protein
MARPPRFELGTLCLEGRCSIQLSYGRVGLALPYFRTFGACAGKLCDWRVNFVESLGRQDTQRHKDQNGERQSSSKKFVEEAEP